MTEISCFYNHFNKETLKYIFIKYDKFVKVIFNCRSIILTIEQLVTNTQLFQIYILSLLCTSNTSVSEVCINTGETIEIEWNNDDKHFINRHDIINDAMYTPIYGIYTQKCWKSRSIAIYYEFVKLYDTSFKKRRDPLYSLEPKRSSSSKKIRKFMKLFVKSIDDYIIDPLSLIYLFNKTEQGFLTDYFTRYIEQEKNVELRASMLHKYGHDVYKSISRFL